MGTFTVRRQVAAPAPTVWQAITHWPSHGRWVPLTTIRVTSPRPDGVGATFVGRTGVGPLAFDDPMTVTRWEPPDGTQPGRCDLRKTGRVVLGGAQLVVRPLGDARCALEWTERAEIPGVRRLPLAGRVDALVGAAVFGYVLRRMAREVEGRRGIERR